MSDEIGGVYVEDEEVEKHLDSPQNVLNRLNFRRLHNGGREKDIPNFPETTKILAGAFAHISGNKASGEAFGMTPQQAMNIKKGNSGGEELQKGIENALGKVRDVALERLTTSLGFVTDEKLSKASVRDVASVAKDMASIVEKTTPSRDQGHKIGVQFQIMTVEPYKDESRYQVVEIEGEG